MIAGIVYGIVCAEGVLLYPAEFPCGVQNVSRTLWNNPPEIPRLKNLESAPPSPRIPRLVRAESAPAGLQAWGARTSADPGPRSAGRGNEHKYDIYEQFTKPTEVLMWLHLPLTMLLIPEEHTVTHLYHPDIFTVNGLTP